ncbi:hypothetical protein ACSSS7_005058 [Eimeria intestinalis]
MGGERFSLREPLTRAFHELLSGYPISTPFTSLRGPPGSETVDSHRDTYTECYCLSSSLQHLGCTPNSWVWVSPAGAPPGAHRRLLRLLALPGNTNEGGPPGGPPCRCWMRALAVPPVKQSTINESSCEGEEAADDEVSVHPSAGGSPSANPPPLFLPSHVLNTLRLAPGSSEVEVWGAPLNSGGPPKHLNDDPVPPPFRCLPRAARCQVQQLSPPHADSWGPVVGHLGAPATVEEADELLNDYFSVPRLVSVGDVFAIVRRPFRYGAPCCEAPCNGGPSEAPHEGTKGPSKGCPCCVSLHEIEHAEAFGLGPSRCEHLASRVLFKVGSNHPWGPLFCEGPRNPGGGGANAAAPQGPSAQGSANGADGGLHISGKAGMMEAEVGAPTGVRREGPAPSCMGGGPCCHWSLEDGVYGCGYVEDLSKVAVLFRVTALEGPPEGPPNSRVLGGLRREPLFGLVFRGSTELMLQEAPGWGPSLPFGIHFVLRRPPLPLLPSLQSPFTRLIRFVLNRLEASASGRGRGSVLLCASSPGASRGWAQGSLPPSAARAHVVSLSALSPLSCGGSFLVKRLCSFLGFPLAVVNCNSLSPPAAEAAAAKGIVHCDGTAAPGGNSLFSATLVERASGGGPCLILLQHLEALMQDPGAPPSRLERLDQKQPFEVCTGQLEALTAFVFEVCLRVSNPQSLLAAHLRWFLVRHQKGGPPGGPPSAGPVLVVGTCKSEGESKAEGLGSELRSAFEVVVNIPRPDKETRQEVFRRLTKTSGALCFAVEASSRRAAEEFAELTNGLSIAEARRFFAQLVETAAEAAHASRADAQPAEDGNSLLSEALQLPPKALRKVARLFLSDPNGAGSNIPGVKWESVGGMEEAKEQIRQLITLPLQHPKLFTTHVFIGVGLLQARGREGAVSSSVRLARGRRFWQKPLLQNATYIGESEKNIRDLFARAKACQPCVLFFDEIDALVRDSKATLCYCCYKPMLLKPLPPVDQILYCSTSSRSSAAAEWPVTGMLFVCLDSRWGCTYTCAAQLPRRGRASDSGGVLDRVVAQVLSEMDDLPPRVFPIGATNRIELLDGAALRAGRLDRRVYVGVQQDKGPLLRAQTGPLVVRRVAPLSLRSLAAGQAEAEEVVASISRQVPPGATGADCRALCNTACLLATKERIRFARSLEGWSLMDEDAPSLGCTYRVTLHSNKGGLFRGPLGGPQVTLELMANRTLTDEAGGLQVWRGRLDVREDGDSKTSATPPNTTLWVVSVLPPAEARRCLDAVTLELLLTPKSPQRRSSEEAPVACPALLNQSCAAVWMGGTAREAEGPPNPLLQELNAYQGPPPCFAFAVHVLERHFIEALKELRPSVSEEDLRKYELLRDQYAVGAPLRAAETAAPIRIP